MQNSIEHIQLEGELVAAAMAPHAARIASLASEGARRFVLHMRDVTFVDSTALGLLIKTHKHLREVGAEMVLAEPSRFFRTTVATLGIDQLLTIRSSVDEAVAHLDSLPR